MKVLHVIDNIARTSGGPSRSSQGLVAALNLAGVEAWLASCKVGEEAWLPGVTHFRSPIKPGLKEMKRFLEDLILEIKPDLIHLHGIWVPPFHFAAKLAQKYKIPYITAPRGCLEPWSLQQKKWKKRLAMFLYQRSDLKRATMLHATATSEAEQFRKLGFSQEVIESPNGVILPNELPMRVTQKDGFRRVLFISRIHKKKGLLNLVEAWAKIRPQGWKIEIVGPDSDAFQRVVEEAIRVHGLEDDFIFTGALMDDDKWMAYRRADLFVLPTFSENFGIVIPEAMYAGLPVITTVGTPWQELQTHRCGWWIDIGVDPLVQALKEAFALSDEERQAMGARGHQLVVKKYTWPAIGKQMVTFYERLRRG